MGRNLISNNQLNILHPTVSLSLLIASIVATLSLITSLCALFRRKQPLKSPFSPIKTNKNIELDPSSHINQKNPEETKAIEPEPIPPTVEAAKFDGTDEVATQLPLPRPPGKAQLSSSTSRSKSLLNRSTSSASEGKSFLSNLSMKLQRIGSRQSLKVLNQQDSILMKKIILGDKCRVPDEEDDTILLDQNGHRISTYHPRKPNSLPISRQTSSNDPEAIQTSISMRQK